MRVTYTSIVFWPIRGAAALPRSSVERLRPSAGRRSDCRQHRPRWGSRASGPSCLLGLPPLPFGSSARASLGPPFLRCATAGEQGSASPPAGDLSRRAQPHPPEVGAGLPEWRRGRGAADSAPACRVESGWRRSLRLGGSENSANTCLEEGREALEQLLLFLWGLLSGRQGGGSPPRASPPRTACLLGSNSPPPAASASRQPPPHSSQAPLWRLFPRPPHPRTISSAPKLWVLTGLTYPLPQGCLHLPSLSQRVALPVGPSVSMLFSGAGAGLGGPLLPPAWTC